MLVANDKVQRTASLLAGRSCWAWSWHGRSGSSARRAFVFFVVHVERANNEELSGGICDFVKTFSRGPRRSFERDLDTLRSINFGAGVPPGFAPGATLWPGDGVCIDDPPRSSGKGRRRNDVMLSTLASSKMLISI